MASTRISPGTRTASRTSPTPAWTPPPTNGCPGDHAGILQITVDLATGTPLSEPISLWSGTGLKFPEAPHLYQHDGAWYLVIAEGGTERGHGISVARGPRASGPFESGPGNPVVSARSTSRPIQNTGHGDLVQTPDGGWAVVMLGMRPKGATQAFSALGRETFITAGPVAPTAGSRSTR